MSRFRAWWRMQRAEDLVWFGWYVTLALVALYVATHGRVLLDRE